VDVSRSVTLHGQRPAWAVPSADTGAKAAGDQLGFVVLHLNRTAAQEAAFTAFVDSLQTPSSPNYHHWITPQQAGVLYGPAQADVDAVVNWLTGQGLHVTDISPTRTFITFSGSTGQLNAAFQTELHNYNVKGEVWIAPASDPQIPAALSSVLRGIHGLSTVKHYPTLHQTVVPMPPNKVAGSSAKVTPEYTSSSTGSHYVTPGDFAAIYDINSVYSAGYTGAGQRIAIIGQSRVYATDITNFQGLVGLTFTQPKVVIPTSLGGVDPGSPCTTQSTKCADSDQGEQTLDVERVGSTAYGASMDLVVSSPSSTSSVTSYTSDGLDIALYYATNYMTSTDKVMTMSYGGCESTAFQGASSSEMAALITYYDGLYKTAAAAGVSFFVSSGDAGVNGCGSVGATPSNPQYASPNFLCASGYVTCTGGTEFTDTTSPGTYWSSSNTTASNGAQRVSALGYIPEGAWNEPTYTTSTGGTAYEYASSGGGVSGYIATPGWQTGTGVPSARAGRYTPDISFTSADHDGYYSCFAGGGGDCVTYISLFSGTSAAAPSMAGITALLNQAVGAHGNLNPSLYTLATSVPAAFHDVTVATSGVGTCNVLIPSVCNNSTPSSTSLTGGETGYAVTAGYDEVTGLGSVDVAKLMTAVTSTVPGYAASIASVAVTAGQTATGTITLTTTDGFDPTQVTFNAITFSGLPSSVTGLSTTPTFTKTATNTYTATFTLSSTASNGISQIATAGNGKPSAPTILLILFSMLLFFGFDQQKAARRVSMLLLLLVALISLGACSSSSSGSSSKGTYAVTAILSNAASGSYPAVSQSAAFTLTIQ
jgi:subtilase family serine protease